ncbi:pyridoxamine 5'-phosphate oxidase [Sanyastnella coralliicola]|uniref:pyridoxamine 5'-phosphate oxidase n=1 Tax=Sanyastnella coralliicola TaxID=3069118 RepID=UPI0027B90521|nr:pyridoxamine 5'-phosphate oxidase [Longitalea sp. SCSIO 12813]
MKDLGSVRKDYSTHILLESEAHEDPFDQFEKWMEEARTNDPEDYNAMNLATIGDHGFPNQRIVLLREFSREGLVFYTNYNSVKGQEIGQDPKVAINFFWKGLERQIRVKGEARKLPAEVSDAYFASRPRESQLGAWVSDQSTVIKSREELERRMKEIEDKYEGKEVDRPSHWGGYRVFPVYFEFWQGRPGRLHDRLSYRVDADGAWYQERLAP